MQRFLIKCVNCSLLVIVLIGIPAITGIRFGTLQVSAVPTMRGLMLWGLSLAAIANVAAALVWAGDRKSRALCWSWAVIFGALLGVEMALVQGYLNFNWLKQALLRLQGR